MDDMTKVSSPASASQPVAVPAINALPARSRSKAPPPSVRSVSKSNGAYRTIAEVAAELSVATHVLRFWESKFPQLKPTKQSGGRRFYKPEDVALLKYIQQLLYRDGYTIRGVQAALKQTKPRELKALVQQLTPQAVIAELAAIKDLLTEEQTGR